MIVLDEEDQRQVKQIPSDFLAGPILRLPERVAGRSSYPLPDYETSQAQHTTISSFRKVHLYGRFDSRFWRAVLIGLAIYVALSVCIGIPLIFLRVIDRRHHHPPTSMNWVDDTSTPVNLAYFSAQGLDSSACNHWQTTQDSISEGTFTAKTQHDFSTNDLLSLRSNVSTDDSQSAFVSGSLNVLMNPESNASSTTINVDIQTSSADLRDRTHICFYDTGTDRGLVIYTPSNLTMHDLIRVDITLLFPSSSSILSVKKLTTHLPTFTQTFGDLNPYINFDKISVGGTQSNISATSLRGSNIRVHSSLASISGAFNVTESLVLDTIGGFIHANVTLVHEPTSEAPTVLTLDTGNSDIDAQVTLVAPHVHSLLRPPPPVFLTCMKTFNGLLKVDIANDPSTGPVPLHVNAENNLAETYITLDDKFEGSFSVRTKLASAIVKEGKPNPSADPSGDNRQRSYVYDHTSESRSVGWVGWGTRPTGFRRGQGHVDVVSSLSPVSLQLGTLP